MNIRGDVVTQSLERDGFVVLRNLLNAEDVTKAHREVEEWSRKDLEDRARKAWKEAAFVGEAGRSQLNSGKQVLIDFFGRSPTLDRIFGEFLTHPAIQETLDRALGKHYKIRGYNIRILSGNTGLSSMEWHRDNPHEFNMAIVLNETAPLEDGATCFVPGSHRFPFCPWKAALIPMPHAAGNPTQKIGIASKILARRTMSKVEDASGNPGDCYLFFGDIWHGRQPNLHGKNGMVFFIGLFPSEVPFPGPVEIPPQEVLDRLPETVRKIVNYKDLPPNSGKNALTYKIAEGRDRIPVFSLWNLTRLERRAMEIIKPSLLKVRLKNALRPYLKPLLQRLRRAS